MNVITRGYHHPTVFLIICFWCCPLNMSIPNNVSPGLINSRLFISGGVPFQQPSTIVWRNHHISFINEGFDINPGLTLSINPIHSTNNIFFYDTYPLHILIYVQIIHIHMICVWTKASRFRLVNYFSLYTQIISWFIIPLIVYVYKICIYHIYPYTPMCIYIYIFMSTKHGTCPISQSPSLPSERQGPTIKSNQLVYSHMNYRDIYHMKPVRSHCIECHP